MNVSPDVAPSRRAVLVEPDSRMRPKTVSKLAEWQYLERSIQRLLAAWGRNVPGFHDKSAIHRFVWEQAECVKQLRDRLVQFPGDNVETPVSNRLEELANAVLLAPTYEDALDGVFRLLSHALAASYSQYARSAHGVHDAPTLAIIHQLIATKEQQKLWFRDYRRRHPHTTDDAYVGSVNQALEACGRLDEPLAIQAPAALVGVNTHFRLAARVQWDPEIDFDCNIMPWLKLEFASDIEVRRLFWCYGYLREKVIPEDQLRWLWDTPYMPWDFHRDVARHLWDESRHGDSGCSRLLDFGIQLTEIGLASNQAQPDGPAEPMTREQVFHDVYWIGYIAETGHFKVKQEGYQDFRDGGDLESAEMMLFDIIDENAHVQYAHRWLPVLAQHAGIDAANLKQRAEVGRAQHLADITKLNAEQALKPKDEGYRFMRALIERMRTIQPLTNSATCPPRSPLPM